jgi:oligopeptide/dipeptide ABC transporter ATP-binding protein
MLSVQDLAVVFDTDHGPLEAVRGVSFELEAGETLGIVGESGSGKTALALALIKLLPDPPGRVAGGRVLLAGRDLASLSETELGSVRGAEVGFIFQDPMVSLNPVIAAGRQVAEAILVHNPKLRADVVRKRVLALFESVGLADPEAVYGRYPHEMSGGMRQRALIAIAVANSPRLIIADEPTTALDVTVQAQVMETLKHIQAESGTAMLVISHDLGLVSEVADRVIVMYAGRIVEQGPTLAVLDAPHHPYTAGLIASAPSIEMRGGRLPVIPGSPPNPLQPRVGCSFQPRCFLSEGRAECNTRPSLEFSGSVDHAAACHFSDELPARKPVSENVVGHD